MKNHSEAFIYIVNLSNASHDHLRRGCGDDCVVSFRLLRETAHFLLKAVYLDERGEALDYIRDMPK